jgi:hypothetical protein
MIKLNFKSKTLISLVAFVLFTAGVLAITLPNVSRISNGLINATLYLPDNDSGYYRGVRFDRSGLIPQLTFNRHSYFGQWYKVYGPTINDAIMGPVEAFDPLGYDNAKPGDTFVKIGVGTLIKPDNSPYNFARDYQLANAGAWKVKTGANKVDYEHTLNDTGYSYAYHKTIELIKGKPLLVISHTLKNTGTHTIETAVFDHNFFVMDNQHTGPGFVVTFPLKLTESLAGKEDYVKYNDNQLVFLKELEHKNVSFKDVTNGKGCTYDIKIENRHTGAGVRITGDKPISKMVFWSAQTTLCPEPYINVKATPGQEFTWKITYEFYNCPVTN